jgi:hypothetical protein
MAPVVCQYRKLFLAHPEDVRAGLTVQNATDRARSSCEGDLSPGIGIRCVGDREIPPWTNWSHGKASAFKLGPDVSNLNSTAR